MLRVDSTKDVTSCKPDSQLRVDSDQKAAAKHALQDVSDMIRNLVGPIISEAKAYQSKVNLQTLYIPTLRTLRQIHEGSDALLSRTRADYFKDQQVDIFTGQALYNEIQQLLLGNLTERETVKDFEEFISRQFFESQPLALIPKLKSKTLEVKIGHEIELPIHDLGDGIQSILILTFPLFKHREDSLIVFYEEPEMFMHPGIQRVFLNTLCTFQNHQFFMTTHSNHFLDITLDLKEVSVFTFRKRLAESQHKEKEASFEIENVSSGHHSCLELLGVRNSSVFLSNCTIWVEGITDRRYLAHYLKLYVADKQKTEPDFKEFKEDLHYSFVEYGGSNITHWSFLDDIPDPINVERLCSRLFLIADKDTFEPGAKGDRHEKLRKALGEQFFLLECKEIENLLAPEVLKNAVASYEKESPQFVDELKWADYAAQPLGTFIEDKLLSGKKSRKGSYAAESGTVRDKVNFCDKAIAVTRTFQDMSPHAKELGEKVYNFIAANNG